MNMVSSKNEMKFLLENKSSLSQCRWVNVKLSNIQDKNECL